MTDAPTWKQCTDDTWFEVWQAFHSARGNQVSVRIAHLQEIAICDREPPPKGLVIDKGRLLATCDRDVLFKWLTGHGPGCGKHIDA